jgi:DNA-binding MarR family transcriptional regulator
MHLFDNHHSLVLNYQLEIREIGKGNFKNCPEGKRAMFQPAILVWLRLYRIVQKIDRMQMAHLRNWGLNIAQFDVLAHVGAHKGITQQELADSLLVTKGNISQLLDRMEDLGLLTRNQEKRNKNIVLTEKGQELFNRVVPAHEQMIAEQLAVLSPSEIADLRRILGQLDRALP